MSLKPETMEKMVALLGKADETQLRFLNEIAVGNLRGLQRAKAFTNALKLDIGDRVRISGVKPKYLNGMTGELITPPPTAPKGCFAVRLDLGPFNKFRSGIVTFRNAGPLEKI